MIIRKIALSIRQPWAWLIVHGFKDVENRSWCADAKGEIAIHAGMQFDEYGYDYVRECFPNIHMPRPKEFPRGGVVGLANHYTTINPECRDFSPWHEYGHWGFALKDARPLKLIRCKGQLGFFWVGIPEKVLCEASQNSHNSKDLPFGKCSEQKPLVTGR